MESHFKDNTLEIKNPLQLLVKRDPISTLLFILESKSFLEQFVLLAK